MQVSNQANAPVGGKFNRAGFLVEVVPLPIAQPKVTPKALLSRFEVVYRFG